jgi:DNA-binding transcriptional MerR regulator
VPRGVSTHHSVRCVEADRRRDRGERLRYTSAQRNPRAHIPHDWEDMTLDELEELFNCQRPTPQATIEAIMHSVRERGLGALKEPANIERLVRCDQAAKEQIDRRIAKLVRKAESHE